MTGGVQSRLATCLCSGCHLEAYPEAMSATHLELCWACAASLEAELATERANEFQARSHEWFTDLSPVAIERKSASYEDNDYDTPSIQEQYEASFRQVF